PFTQVVKETLIVQNPNREPVAFKVKTTAPKQYCVRPNSVILQPMKEDLPPDYKCKDKFLVQSVAITPERENLSLQELWSITEKQAKETIKENKIRCVYSPPVAQVPQQISQQIPNNLSPASPPPNLPLPPQPSTRSVADTLVLGGGGGGGGVHDPAKLRKQLLESQEEIKRLSHTIENYKQELNTSQMRQRRIDDTTTSTVTASNRHSVQSIGSNIQERIPEGYYPFEVVVGAAVGAFLFGVM
ncbi:6610_t:CDS:2, partial [Diversispora eburnea]